MAHEPGKFRGNTAMRHRVTVRKRNVTDRQTDRLSDGGHFSISHPGPSVESQLSIFVTFHADRKCQSCFSYSFRDITCVHLYS